MPVAGAALSHRLDSAHVDGTLLQAEVDADERHVFAVDPNNEQLIQDDRTTSDS